MSSDRIFWAFREFCSAVIRETGEPPERVTLPLVAFQALATEIGARAVWVGTDAGGESGIMYQTGFGAVLIQHSP